jgi:hypothetical protein
MLRAPGQVNGVSAAEFSTIRPIAAPTNEGFALEASVSPVARFDVQFVFPLVKQGWPKPWGKLAGSCLPQANQLTVSVGLLITWFGN